MGGPKYSKNGLCSYGDWQPDLQESPWEQRAEVWHQPELWVYPGKAAFVWGETSSPLYSSPFLPSPLSPTPLPSSLPAFMSSPASSVLSSLFSSALPHLLQRSPSLTKPWAAASGPREPGWLPAINKSWGKNREMPQSERKPERGVKWETYLKTVQIDKEENGKW